MKAKIKMNLTVIYNLLKVLNFYQKDFQNLNLFYSKINTLSHQNQIKNYLETNKGKQYQRECNNIKRRMKKDIEKSIYSKLINSIITLMTSLNHFTLLIKDH